MSSKRFGLTGEPLGHSLSPFIHGKLTEIRGISGSYELFETERGNLEQLYKNTLIKLDGFNVTIPYKTKIIPMLDTLSERAELLGSVNTVSFENEKAKGHNTDCTGFLRSLEYAGIQIGKSVLICGCGGVGRTFAFECALKGADITFAVRPSSFEKAEALKNEMNVKLNKSAEIITPDCVNKEYDLIINATPVGMYPEEGFSPLEKEAVKKAKAVFDAVYNPAETLFLRYAKECGIKRLNGLPMLVWQAAAAEEIWNGVKYEKEEIDRIINLTEKELKKK